MAEDRVKAGFWVAMALRMGQQDGRYGVVVRRGDEDAGGILVLLRDRTGGLCVLSQVRDAEGEAAWLRATGSAPVDDAAADAYVARQLRSDPDLWVLEFESPDLLPPFAGRILD